MLYPTSKTFAEIFPTAESLRVLRNEWITLCPRQVNNKDYITDDNLNLVWAVLAAKFSESHINFTKEQPFKLKLLSIVAEATPKFIKDIEIQQKLASLKIDDDADMAFIARASSFVVNHADHPATDPDTESLDSLTYIDTQDINTNKRGELDSMAYLSALMRSNLYTAYTNRFKPLFVAIAFPDCPCEEENRTQDIKEVTITHNGQTSIGPDLGFDHMNNVVANIQVPGGGANVQATKTVTITENGNTVSLPDEGYDAVAATQISVNVPTPAVEQTKEVEITANGDYASTPSAGYNGVVNTLIHVEVPSTTRIQFGKSVTITSNGTRTVTPDSGYDALAGVSVTTNVSKSLQNLGTIVPTTSQQTFNFDTAHYDGYNNFVVNPVTRTIDSNIKAANIKSGVSILGVTGTYEGEGGGGPECLEWFEEFDWTPSANIQEPHTFEFDDHGSAPNVLYIYLDKTHPTFNREFGGCMLFTCPSNYNWAATAWAGNMFYRQTTNQWYKTSPTSSTGVTAVDNTTITLRPNDYSGQQCIFLAGDTYHIMVGRFANAEV